MALELPTVCIHPEVNSLICLSTLDVCVVCLRANVTQCCGSCGCSTYCSKECQKADWKKSHKKICPSIAKAGVLVWLKDAKKTIKKAQKKKLLVVTPNTTTNDNTSNDDETEKVFQKAIDLMTGSVGYIHEQDQVVASSEDLDQNGFLGRLKKGRLDRKEGKRLLLKAANGGHKGAMYAFGTEGSEKEMLKWCRTAAQLGHAEAQVTMGSYWKNGTSGHPVDVKMALLWMRLGMAHGAIGMPDPRGDFLSKDSFRKCLDVLPAFARELAFANNPFFCDEDDDEEEIDLAKKLAASCGSGAAIADITYFSK